MGVVIRQKEKRKGAPYWVFINHNGKRRSKLIGDKKTAEAVASKIKQKLKLGEFKIEHEKNLPLFKDYASHWIETYAVNACKFTTYEWYKGFLKSHINPVLGNKPIDQITKSDIKNLLYNKLNQGLSVSTVKGIRATISVILNHAIEDDELIASNPAMGLGKIIKNKKPKEDIAPFTREEVTKFLDTCLEHFPCFHPLFLCSVRTGMRIGEILALKWEDIDFNGRFIQVKRNLVKGRITLPKSGKTRRVDMSLQLTRTLKGWLTTTKGITLQNGWGAIPEWVFYNEEGNTLDEDNLRKRVFYKCLEKAGLRRITIHMLRHTYASLLIAQAESLAYVQEQLGHHSIKVTVDTYGHLIPGANKSAVDKLDDDRREVFETNESNISAPIRTLYAPTNKKEVSAIG